MNKIHYILDLTGIKMPENVKKETAEKIKTSEQTYQKKHGRKKAAVVLASVFAFTVLVISAAVIVNAILSNHATGPDITTDDVIDITETDAPGAEVHEEKYYIFDRPYNGYYRYDIFKTVISLIKPYENDILLTASDLSPLYRYFGNNEISADDLCETFFAFYEKGSVINFAKIPEHSSVIYEKTGEKFSSNDQSLWFYAAPDELHFEEIILMTAKNGTFEYLLTLPVNTANTYIYDRNTGTRKIGKIKDGKYYISQQYIEEAEANVYKIRFEAGLPVIYAKYTLPQGNMVLSNGSIFFTGLQADETDGESKTVKSGHFIINNNIIEFKCEENDMINPVYTERGLNNLSQAKNLSLCEYPYSLPAYDKNSGLCGRKTVCDIINMYDLQWFFPMYVKTLDNGMVQIIGEGITTGDEAYMAESAITSTVHRIYGTAYENNIYTTYGINMRLIQPYLSSTPQNDLPDYSVGLCYMPETCDAPYFDRSYFDADRMHMIITLKDNEIVTLAYDSVYPGYAKQISSDMLPEYVTDITDISEFEPLFHSDLPYIKDSGDMYSPTRPFDVKYLPLLSDETVNTPELFKRFGLSVPEYEHINGYLSNLTLGHREICVTDAETIKSSGYTAAAYEEINGYITDMAGLLCGIAGPSGVCMFTTVEPCFELTLKAENGCVTYLSYQSDIYSDTSDNEFQGLELYSGEESYGIGADTFLYMLYKAGEKAPVTDMFGIEYDSNTGTYKTRINVMNLPDNEVFGVKNGDKRIYHYYDNVTKTVQNGRVTWLCEDNHYMYGFSQHSITYDGYNIELNLELKT